MSNEPVRDFPASSHIRGPGFIGVVTEYTLRLFLAPGSITTSSCYYPLERIEEVSEWAGSIAHKLPRQVQFVIEINRRSSKELLKVANRPNSPPRFYRPDAVTFPSAGQRRKSCSASPSKPNRSLSEFLALPVSLLSVQIHSTSMDFRTTGIAEVHRRFL
jgi:hypothetical protein